MKLLERKDNIDYICLLDDDIEIIQDFSSYINTIFNTHPIPLLTNYNYQLDYKESSPFVETENFFGNFLIFRKKEIPKKGYFGKFEYIWGEEHVEITNRYLKNTKYYNHAINLTSYIKNEQIINEESTLHIHSMEINEEGVNKNKAYSKELLKKNSYIDFVLNENDILLLQSHFS